MNDKIMGQLKGIPGLSNLSSLADNLTKMRDASVSASTSTSPSTNTSASTSTIPVPNEELIQQLSANLKETMSHLGVLDLDEFKKQFESQQPSQPSQSSPQSQSQSSPQSQSHPSKSNGSKKSHKKHRQLEEDLQAQAELEQMKLEMEKKNS